MSSDWQGDSMSELACKAGSVDGYWVGNASCDLQLMDNRLAACWEHDGYKLARKPVGMLTGSLDWSTRFLSSQLDS